MLTLANQKKLGKINHSFGAWRSLVAHLHGVQGVAGSNPAVPTILYTVLLFGVVRIIRQPLIFLGIIIESLIKMNAHINCNMPKQLIIRQDSV